MKKFRRILFSFFVFAFPLTFFSQEIPQRPDPPELVNNLSKEMPDFLTATEEAQLEGKLVQFARETSNQIVIVIVDDLGGSDANSFATKLGQDWGVGKADKDNGIVILVKPTGPPNQRDVYIAVGYGLEGPIPDITANHIKQEILVPNFKAGNYYEGLDAATDVLMKLAKGEYNAKDYGAAPEGGRSKLFIFLILGLLLLVTFIGRGARRGGYTIG
ncbi:MAG TPA: TPM domain-containing protein, partial [Bacteroidia bacterium]|nr:TPM domain-containing protein [Bacteroidia bacterium]